MLSDILAACIKSESLLGLREYEENAYLAALDNAMLRIYCRIACNSENAAPN
jgi:hypothetical protein